MRPEVAMAESVPSVRGSVVTLELMLPTSSHLATALLASGFAVFARAQITVDPAFPTQDETITLTYDAAAGNGALADCTCDVYLHTGLITDASQDPSDWQFVATEWATTNPDYAMTPVEGQPNVYEIEIDIPSFYGYTAGTVVRQLAFVFRDATGDRVGRAADGGDLFYDVAQAGADFAIRVESPTGTQNLFDVGEAFTLRVAASAEVASYVLTDNGEPVATVTTPGPLERSLTAAAGNHLLRVLATSADGDTSSVSIRYVGLVELAAVDVPTGVEPGYTDLGGGRSAFYLYAPEKRRALVRMNTNDFGLEASLQMAPVRDGTGFYLEMATPAEGGFVYQYVVDDVAPIADPFSDLILDPFNDPFIDASVFPGIPELGTDVGLATWVRPEVQFAWTNDDFERPGDGELVIYELLIRDFTEAHTYQSLIDSLGYFQRLGINAIELMPVNEFEGNLSWGYNPSYHMALDKYYGTPERFKAFVDAAHGAGIAVLVDVVFNHGFGQNPYVQLYAAERAEAPDGAGPFYNLQPRHPFNVGVDANHESVHQQRYTGRILRHWLEEYHLDGYRFDLSKGFTQTDYGTGDDAVGAWSEYDQGRVDILNAYQDTIRAVDAGAYVILEHFATGSEERRLTDDGMFVWGNMAFAYAQAASGNAEADLYGVTPQSRGFGNDRLVGYMESHDEQRMLYEIRESGRQRGDYDTRAYTTSLARAELAANFFYTVPGARMLWQFGEYGYPIDINENGRTGNKPILWELLERQANRRLFNVTASLIKLRRDFDVFREGAFDNLRSSLGSGELRTISVEGDAFDALIVGNFGLTNRTLRVDLPVADGDDLAYEYWSGETLTVPSTGQTRLSLAPGEYRLYTSVALDPPQGGYLQPVSGMAERLPPGARVQIVGNPSHEILQLEIGGWSEPLSLGLFDATGRQVLHRELGAVAGLRRIPVDPLAAGTYTVALTDAGGGVWTGLWTRL